MKEYFIPHNFKDNGKILGCFEKRYFYSALCWLIPMFVLLCALPLPFPLTESLPTKVFVFIILICPPTLLIAFGYADIVLYLHDFKKQSGVYKKKPVNEVKTKLPYDHFIPVKRIAKGIVQLKDGQLSECLKLNR